MENHYYKDSKGRDCIYYEHDGKCHNRVIKDGMERYIFEHESIGDLVYHYVQKAEYMSTYRAEQYQFAKQKKINSYTRVREGKKAVRYDEPLYEDMK